MSAVTIEDSHLPIQFSRSRPSQEGYWQGVAGESVAPIPKLLPVFKGRLFFLIEGSRLSHL